MSELIVYRCHGCENCCAVIVQDKIKPNVCITANHKQKWTRFENYNDIKKVGDD